MSNIKLWMYPISPFPGKFKCQGYIFKVDTTTFYVCKVGLHTHMQ